MDKITKLFFGFLVFFFLLLVAIWNTPNLENATGIKDSIFSTLQRSGTTVVATSATKWLAYFFGLGIIGVFAFCLFIGARKKQEALRKSIYTTLAFGIFLYLVAYTVMVLSWWQYEETNSMVYFMGLPKPTAWMMFVLMFTPVLITSIYIFKFKEWIITEEELDNFNKIVARRRQRGMKN